MPEPNPTASPVDAKAILVDRATMRVVWLNESAAHGLPDDIRTDEIDLAHVIPMAESLGVADAMRIAAETGTPQHLSVNIVATSKGAMALVISIYPVPGDMLLILADNTWEASKSRRR